MRIIPNEIYRSKAGEATVMPVAATDQRVIVLFGRQFGNKIIFDNRRTIMTRQEFEDNFELAE